MKSLSVATAMVALLAAAPAVGQGNKTSQGANSGDAKFIEHVARAGQAEVDLGRLGEQKAQATEVKALARRLVADHTNPMSS